MGWSLMLVSKFKTTDKNRQAFLKGGTLGVIQGSLRESFISIIRPSVEAPLETSLSIRPSGESVFLSQ